MYIYGLNLLSGHPPCIRPSYLGFTVSVTCKEDRLEAEDVHRHFVNPQCLILRPSYFSTIAGIGRDPKNTVAGNEYGPLVSLLLEAQMLTKEMTLARSV